ncbi:hypothetical protein HCN51_31550 [Nonomuraea sp. FMUSA5-5]|uniref:Uncharacterized protein n=1 Tax=Nonomuraea composti TaxID=2720023 RepID=A0ABX1BBI5_9ACTN|nr:DUF6221 family protein [Nonomuraea sp. FMUSA5-5]NJP93920.1 hypothetical protein [Nonomuraea sp. FMUSA5-5]
MDELVMFLRARLDEDEQEALAASPGPWKANAEQDEVLAVDDIEVATGFALSGEQLRATVRHIVRHDPPRALREVASKRRIIDREVERAREGWRRRLEEHRMTFDEWAGHFRWETLDLLAAAYADHPEYQEQWRPPA